MSEKRTEVINRQGDRHFWRHCRSLLALLAVGVMGAGGALAVGRANHPPQMPGGGCGWGNLKGALATPPKFVLALDGDFNIQGFFAPGSPGSPKNSPPDKSPDAVIELTKFGSATIYCYKIDGKRECIEI
jgi:hypothetical protein